MYKIVVVIVAVSFLYGCFIPLVFIPAAVITPITIMSDVVDEEKKDKENE